ncbi:hypothetical protein [Aminobacter sp. BE322]|uniref:hypothetical protein n=1 Tax=unclassified Aminobacter TaxID=2644704 RepID=UPI003D206732
MGLKFVRLASVSMLAGVIVAAALAPAMAKDAGSLAGKVGTKRYPAQFGQSGGPCKKAYQEYVAAPGHSAYAQTAVSYNVEAVFCGRAYNAPSQKVAEEQALANCNSVGKKYKLKTTGNCSIYVSK